MSNLTERYVSKINAIDIVNSIKEYVDNHGGGITLDDNVTQNSSNGVKSSGIYTAIQAASGGGGTWYDITLSTSGWSGNTYSFENTYPSSSYDILDILPKESTTTAQRNAWVSADCGGYYASNIIIAHGTKPTIDIPLKIYVKSK